MVVAGKKFGWIEIYRLYNTVISTLLIPVGIWTFNVYTSFIELKVNYKNTQQQLVELKESVLWNKNEAIRYAEVEKTDRILDVAGVRKDFNDFKSEYYRDFPKNYLRSLK